VSETMRMWVEVSFNIVYLITIWGLVIAMWRRRASVVPEDGRLPELIMWAFALLALGDTGHVGFRVLAYALGDLGTTFSVSGYNVGLVGLGALSTAITVTFFYVLMLGIWRVRFDRSYDWLGYLLLAAAGVRLLIMGLPANEWNSVVPPQPWSTLRNVPLMVQGLGVAYLILRDARSAGDKTFQWIGVLILVSYVCYMPVIFFVQRAPSVGMLMIPKTLAYVAMAVLAYRGVFAGSSPFSILRHAAILL
jgi:hypothetical protein